MGDTNRRYHPFYCEENIWHLCESPLLEGREAYVAVISNQDHQVALWAQKAAPANELVVWDYHVLLLAQAPGGWEAWDLDTTLGLPVPALDYLRATFISSPPITEDLAPRFRLVEAGEYRRCLVTDRRHMRKPSGSWFHPPPPWPVIGEGSNLVRFVNIDEGFLGEVVGLEEMLERFG